MAAPDRRPSFVGHVVLIAAFGLWVAAVTVILPAAVCIGSTEHNDRLGVREVLSGAVLYALFAVPAIVLITASSRRLLRLRRENRAATPAFEVIPSQKTDL